MAERRGVDGRTVSLRARITWAATAIVGIALIIGALLFLVLLRVALLNEVRAAVDGDIDQIEAVIDASGELPPANEGDDDRFFQVVSASGAVLAASTNAPAAALDIPDSEEGQNLRIPGEDDEYLVMAEAVDGGGMKVVAGRTLEDMEETLSTVGPLLAGAVPLLIVLVASSTWLVVGRALAPVERMRREVEAVTATRLDRRVADPGRPDEIGRLALTMNGMLNRLEASQRSQRRFISNASHELKSPLASLRQYAEVARSHPDRISAEDLSGAVLDEGARLEHLVQGMLLLARADERSLDVRGTEVDLDDLLLAEARRLRDSTALDVDASMVRPARTRGDLGLLAQLVRNLTDNAAQHASSRVSLSLAVVGESAELVIDDDGPGVPSRQRERIFERFVRLDEARARDSGGSGLGLSIVREIVRAHCGTVQVSDSVLGGARFEVRLPVEPELGEAPAE